jgi:hypothetical protein
VNPGLFLRRGRKVTNDTESLESLALGDKAFSGSHHQDLVRIALNTGVFRDGLLLSVDARVGASLHPTVRIMGYKKNAGGGRLCGLYGKPGDGKSELLKTCASLAPYPRKGSVGKIDTPFAEPWWQHNAAEMVMMTTRSWSGRDSARPRE